MQPILVVPLTKAFSESARKASAEARRAKAASSLVAGGPGSKGGPHGGGTVGPGAGGGAATHPHGDALAAAKSVGYDSARKEVASATVGLKHFTKKMSEMAADGWVPHGPNHPTHADGDDIDNGVHGNVHHFTKNGVLATVRTFKHPGAGAPMRIPKSGISFVKTFEAHTPDEQASMRKQHADAAAVYRERNRRIMEERYGKKPG